MAYEIQPLQIWVNGQTVTVDRFNSGIVDDPMINGSSGSCKFCYYLGYTATDYDGSITVNWVYSNNVTMEGQTYANWSGSNQEGREWICSQIGVILVPTLVPIEKKDDFVPQKPVDIIEKTTKKTIK
jgi:hypothetical protein